MRERLSLAYGTKTRQRRVERKTLEIGDGIILEDISRFLEA